MSSINKVESYTIGQLIKGLRPASLWKILGALAIVISGAFSLGIFINTTNIHKNLNQEKWNFQLFKNTETDKLKIWVNTLNAGMGDVESAISGNDFHVWARKGNAKGGEWETVYIKWGKESDENTKLALDNQKRIILGLSGNNLHYLNWKQRSK